MSPNLLKKRKCICNNLLIIPPIPSFSVTANRASGHSYYGYDSNVHPNPYGGSMQYVATHQDLAAQHKVAQMGIVHPGSLYQQHIVNGHDQVMADGVAVFSHHPAHFTLQTVPPDHIVE